MQLETRDAFDHSCLRVHAVSYDRAQPVASGRQYLPVSYHHRAVAESARGAAGRKRCQSNKAHVCHPILRLLKRFATRARARPFQGFDQRSANAGHHARVYHVKVCRGSDITVGDVEVLAGKPRRLHMCARESGPKPTGGVVRVLRVPGRLYRPGDTGVRAQPGYGVRAKAAGQALPALPGAHTDPTGAGHRARTRRRLPVPRAGSRAWRRRCREPSPSRLREARPRGDGARATRAGRGRVSPR